MTVNINQAIPASVPSSAKTERNGAKGHGEDSDFGSALDLARHDRSHGHHEATVTDDHDANHRSLGSKRGARGENRHDRAGNDKAGDLEAGAGEASLKVGAAPLSAMIAARELDARSARAGKGGHQPEGNAARPGEADPEIKIKLDPASLAAAERAARGATARPTALKGEGSEPAGQILTANDSPTGAAASRANTAKMPNAAAITLSLTPNAAQGDASTAPADPALTPGRDFLQTLGTNVEDDRSQPNAFGRRPNANPQRVTVVAQQNIPAPVAQPGQSTAVGLANLISADPGWKAAATAPSFQPLTAPPSLASAHTLKLQLHPAELGMVTANLRFSGEHLTVELRVENGEAYRRLTADSETIVKSLRSMGLNIDHVTIQQPQSSAAAQGGADGNNASAGFGQRDQQAFASAHSGGDGNSGGRQASAGNTSDGSHGSSEDAAPAAPNRSGDSLYI